MRRLKEAPDGEFEDPLDVGAWEGMVALQQADPVAPVKAKPAAPEAKPRPAASARPPRPRRAQRTPRPQRAQARPTRRARAARPTD